MGDTAHLRLFVYMITALVSFSVVFLGEHGSPSDTSMFMPPACLLNRKS